MEALSVVGLILVGLAAGGYLFWRRVWFYRDPERRPPEGGGILAPADGTVVYAGKVEPGQAVVSIKKGVAATIPDICGQDQNEPMLHVGIFMSPFDVHFNRHPISGTVEFCRHYPPSPRNLHMGRMHWRSVFKRPPLAQGSRHVIQNERKVTRINGRYRGRDISCHLVQIAARTVGGIEVFVSPGDAVRRGERFGIIKIGSQVDLIVSWVDGMNLMVKPGDRVRAGETVLVD